MRLFKNIQDKAQSVIETLDAKVWVKGAWSASGLTGSDDYTGAYSYTSSPYTYQEKCDGVCALGAIDIYLGAIATDQKVISFLESDDIPSDARVEPVDDRLLDWFDSVLVVAGKHFANEIFMQWKGHYFDIARCRESVQNEHGVTRDDVDEWQAIHHMNDHPFTTYADVLNMLGVVDIYPPFRNIGRIRRFPTGKRLEWARHFYKDKAKPYADDAFRNVDSLSGEEYATLLKDANLL